MPDGKGLCLTIDEARALALAAQGLDDLPQAMPTSEAILRAIDRLGVLQVDTISVVERSQYLVLWSRLGAYAPALLDSMLYPQRLVFECMAPVALIAPMLNYRYYRPAMLRAAAEILNGRHEWVAANSEAVRDTLEAVRERGPLASADFERPPDARRTSAWDWHGPKPSRRALEILYHTGDLMVHSRRGGQKLYDLRERVLAEAFGGEVPDDSHLPTADERVMFFARHAVEALGIIQPAWLWEYHAVRPAPARGANRRAEALATLDRLADEGAVVPISVEGLEGPTFMAAALTTWLEQLSAGRRASRTTLLSPFDSLIWDRARTRTLFDFDVCFEAYVAPPKRKYGYYCLSILHDGRLVGRIDPKADRAAKRLLVRAAYLEPGVVVDDPLVEGLGEALSDLAHFLSLDSVEVGTAGHEPLVQALAQWLGPTRRATATTSGTL